MKLKIVHDTSTRLTWAARLIQEGDLFGLDEDTVYRDHRPMVEFFDTRTPSCDLGHYVSSVHVQALLAHADSEPVPLGPDFMWELNPMALRELKQWLRFTLNMPPKP